MRRQRRMRWAVAKQSVGRVLIAGGPRLFQDDNVRHLFVSIVSALLISASTTLNAAAVPCTAPMLDLSDIMAQEFTRPHDRIDIGNGRKINLFCMGTGDRTVVFDAGFSDWSIVWALVQPSIARSSRACSYDRAGLGYSDASDSPSAGSPIAIVQDFHALVRAANIRTPVVLVGHSLGGFNMKLYATLYPEDVAGMVLVDPSEERESEKTDAVVTARYSRAVAAKIQLSELADMSAAISNYARCADATDSRDLDAASGLYKQCSDPALAALGPKIASARERIQVKRSYQVAQAFELANSMFGDHRSDSVYARLFSNQPFGNKPLIVLTRGFNDGQDISLAASYLAWRTAHEMTVGLSRQGVNRVIKNAHHNVHVDQPQAVIAAIEEVLSKSPGGNSRRCEAVQQPSG